MLLLFGGRVPNRGSRGETARASCRDARTRARGSRRDMRSSNPRDSRIEEGCTHLDLSPSRSSTASWMPVEAPEGVMARNMPLWVWTSASTVGLPRESKIWRAITLVMVAGVCFLRYSACVGSRGGSRKSQGRDLSSARGGKNKTRGDPSQEPRPDGAASAGDAGDAPSERDPNAPPRVVLPRGDRAKIEPRKPGSMPLLRAPIHPGSFNRRFRSGGCFPGDAP